MSNLEKISSFQNVSFRQLIVEDSAITSAPTASLASHYAYIDMEQRDRHTTVSVTKGVGVHDRDGCDPACPEKRLKPSLEEFRKAAALRPGGIEALQTSNKAITRFGRNLIWDDIKSLTLYRKKGGCC